jgi:hypothetical protein
MNNLPKGSWINSSRNYRVQDGYLICESKNIQGQYIKNKIKIEDNQTLTNINGKLISNIRFSISKLPQIIKNQKMDIAVVSYGGSGSNKLTDVLELNKYKIRCQIWNDVVCHCPEVIKIDIPIIYIYRNPIDAFFSMKRRGDLFYGVNQKKLSNNDNIKITDENLLLLMIKQFKNWTSSNLDNLLIVKYDEIFENPFLEKIKKFLKNENIRGFPVKFNRPSKKNNYNKSLTKLFEKYKSDIEYINKYGEMDK